MSHVGTRRSMRVIPAGRGLPMRAALLKYSEWPGSGLCTVRHGPLGLLRLGECLVPAWILELWRYRTRTAYRICSTK